MAIAISVKSESGDDYLYCEENISTTDEIINFLKEQLGGEFTYISKVDVKSTKKCKIDINEIMHAVYDEDN